MKNIIRTNDPVLLSQVEMLLREANIKAVTMDQYISAVGGEISAFPKRILVPDQDWNRARQILIYAGLEKQIIP